MVDQGLFREDFYYRVSVIPVHVPPLRERREDIEPLAHHFLRKFTLQMGKPVRDFGVDAVNAMLKYRWPGNVRELENAIEHAVAVSSEGEEFVRVGHLPTTVVGMDAAHQHPTASALHEGIEIPEQGVDFESRLAEIEKQYLTEALRTAGGVRTKAAEMLKMSYRSFRHYAKKHGV